MFIYYFVINKGISGMTDEFVLEDIHMYMYRSSKNIISVVFAKKLHTLMDRTQLTLALEWSSLRVMSHLKL